MDAVDFVLATTSEISLKGENRPWFERHLTRNLRAALSDMPVKRVERPSWRVLVSFSEPVDFREVARRLVTVFGLHSIMPVHFAGHSMDELETSLAPTIDSMTTTSFAVRCTRSDKRFPLTSPEVERSIGSFIQQRTPWPVNLRHPALTVRILVDEHGIYFWMRTVSGPGGMPVGVSGRGACLLSGGIDSPIAAYLMMKRGMRLNFIHFHSVPRTNPASIDKVRQLVAVLNRYQASARLALVPLLTIQEEIVARCPAEFRVLLYRRFMLRIAERIGRRFKAHALVTGEALGQVASQTIENLASVEAIARLPVLRPLISYDKPEIISFARTVGTYEISIQPHQDCCSLLMPEIPATRSFPSELDQAEEPLDVNGLVESTLEHSETVDFEESAAWDEMPDPVFAEP